MSSQCIINPPPETNSRVGTDIWRKWRSYDVISCVAVARERSDATGITMDVDMKEADGEQSHTDAQNNKKEDATKSSTITYELPW